MVFDSLPEWAAQFSFGDVLQGDFSFLIPILYLAVSIAIYSILIWHFYRFIARRNSFKLQMRRYTKAILLLKYFLLFPFVAVLFFAGFALMLFFLTKNLTSAEVLSTSFAIIVAIRITAYYNEDLSKDVAKLLPFALLGVSLVDPSYFQIQDVIEKITSLPRFFTVCMQFLLLIIIIEWIMRILLSVVHHFRPPEPTCE